MQIRINKEKAFEAMRATGLSQSDLATQLDVSKEAVSQWFNSKSFPRPKKLLKLGKLLSLSFDELVIKEDPFAPVVAFRKMKGTKTKDHHIEKAQEQGRFLTHLVPYLPFDALEMPPVLKSPSVNYDYLQQVAQKVRKEINVSTDATIDFNHLIKRFNELQAVLIPVLWGSKQRHENAVHIYLPDSQTTWVYLNLDVNIHDFKFWMAHELGHCLSPNLIGDNAEDFADAFAGALLFHAQKAEQAYQAIFNLETQADQLKYILGLAKSEIISPYTIYYQVNEFARHAGKSTLALESELHKWVANFNKNYPNVSELLFADPKNLSAKDYLQRANDIFDTPFFDVLGQYLRAHQKGAGVIQSIMDIPPLDARSIAEELT
jgi:transcriptional regulator with XRE-family HTH domain